MIYVIVLAGIAYTGCAIFKELRRRREDRRGARPAGSWNPIRVGFWGVDGWRAPRENLVPNMSRSPGVSAALSGTHYQRASRIPIPASAGVSTGEFAA